MIRQAVPQAKIQKYHVNIDIFNGGTNTLISDARLGKRDKNIKYAIQSTNLWQDEDGIWATRPGRKNYGSAIPGVTDIDGSYEYLAANDSREIIVVANGNLYKSTDDGQNWSVVDTGLFTAGNTPQFILYDSDLYISTGVDNIVVYDGSTATTFTGLTDPASAPTVTAGSGLTTGSYNHYYRITANNTIGFTNPSPAQNITTDIPRDQWDFTADEYMGLTWTGVSGADSYDVWYGDKSGYEVFLGSTTDTSFRDIGQQVNPYIEVPDDNTTTGPKLGSMELSGGRLWGTKDPDNPWRVSATGAGQFFSYFSSFYGGFWIDLEKTRYKPVSVTHYRSGRGDPIITVLCSSPDGKGAIFQVETTTTTIGDTTFSVPVAYKLVGSSGTLSASSVVKIGDNIGYQNKKGVYFLRNKEQMFNVLAADDMSGAIRDKMESLNFSLQDQFNAYFKEPRAYFSMAESDSLDTTVLFDMERRNWTYKWTFGAKQFLEYTDTNDITRFLAVPATGNQLIEIDENVTGDFGEGFVQKYLSPLIPIDEKDHTTQAKVREVIFELGDVTGEVSVKVIGKKKNKQVSNLASETVSSTVSNSGWGDDSFSDLLFTDTADTPTTFSQSTIKKRVRVNDKLYAWQAEVSSTSANSSWKLLSIQADGFVLKSRSPSSWN